MTEWLQSGRDFVDTEPMPEQALDQQWSRDDVWRVVQTLSPTLREAIVLRYWAQHSFKEMAVILNCPVGTAQSRVRLGYKKIRKQMTQAQ